MATIHSHQWLEIHEIGREACQSRLLRTEEKELLVALRGAPVRVVDLFRRLRVTDGQAFQEILGKAVSRGWLVVHDANPILLPAPSSEPEAPALSSEDALGALLARYAQEQEQASDALGVTSPEWEKPEASLEELPSESLPLPEKVEALSPVVEQVPSPPAWVEESAPVEKVLPPSPSPPEPAYVETPPEGADALFAAMGLDPAHAQKLSPPPTSEASPARTAKPRESSSGAWGGNQALLDALSAASPSFPPSSSVTVPEYGLAASPSEEAADGAFVRLKDVGAVFGPGERTDDSGGSDTPEVKKTPDDVFEDPTTRTRRRRSARERMLDAARREEADRQTARERAKQLLERKAAEEAQRKEAMARQRAVEEMARGPSFSSRAEKARRIRDGLPPKSD